MKKVLSILMAAALAMGLVACGGEAASTTAPASGASTSTGTAAGAGVAKEDIKVGVIHIGDPAAGSGYTPAHDAGIVEMQQTLGLTDDQIVRKNNVDDGDTTAIENAITECLEEGCNIIFATSWGYMDTCEKLAAEHPEVLFSHGTGYKSNGTNMNHYFGRIYQARYLSGIVAGMKTESNKIGYVAAMGQANGEVTSGINAFAMGVASVNPEAKVYVKVTNSWYTPEGETSAAQALLDDGCDVIAQHCDTPNPQLAAEKAGKWGVGYNSNMTTDAPKATLASVMWDWGKYYTAAVQHVMDGSWVIGEKVEDYFGGMEDGLVLLSELNEELVAEGTAEAVKTAADKITSGEWDVFDGKTEIEGADGQKHTLDGADYGSCNWYVANVVADPTDTSMK